MAKEHRSIEISKYTDDNKEVMYEITKRGTRSVSREWLTRTEAEDLHAQLESILFKEGK